MLPIAPLTVSIDRRRTSCVLDRDIALSRHGPMFAMRMAQEINVWLVRALWKCLDESYTYLNSAILPGGSRDDAREALTQWESIRLENDFAGLNLFWISDAKQESLFPEGCDPNLIQRFSALLCGLDDTAESDFLEREFACEAIALTAALTRHRTVIFTALPPLACADKAAHEPRICNALRENNIACSKLEDGDDFWSLREDWSTLFSLTGVNELIWSGLRPAVVHIVSPRSLVLPTIDPAYSSSNPVLDFSGPNGKEQELWQQAKAFWYPVVP